MAAFNACVALGKRSLAAHSARPAKSRELRIRLPILAAGCVNGRFSRRGAARIFSLTRHFHRCERTQHKMRMISMDGKGRFLDNIFIGRLWRTLKYDYVYLHPWETGSETKAAIRKWMALYNHQRPHSAPGGQPPALVYWQRRDINQPDQQVQRVA